MAHELTPSDSSIHWAVFSHPAVKNRLRFDLTSNGIVGLVAVISERIFHLGDLSAGGFSYVQEIPTNRFVNLQQVREWVAKSKESIIGKQVRANFLFEHHPERGGVSLVGLIKNYAFVMLLSVEEIERETNRFLFQKGIKRKHDPKNSFGKLDVVVRKTLAARAHGKLELPTQIGANVSMLNLLIEVGATEEELHDLYKGLTSKRLFIKYGAEFGSPGEAMDLLEFAKPGALYDNRQKHETSLPEDSATLPPEEPAKQDTPEGEKP